MIVWKIAAEDCPICAEMGEFDEQLISSIGLGFHTLLLEHAAAIERLASYIKSEVMSLDGTVDVPMYILQVDGDFVGAVVGRHSKKELQAELLRIAP